VRPVPRALIPLLAAILAAGVWFGAMEHAGIWQDGQIVDTPTYLHYANAFADGQLPYRDVQVEYPPLAFAVILPPRIVSGSYDSYTSAFTALMGACLVLAAAAGAAAAGALGRSRWVQLAAGAFVALGPAAIGSVSLTRFDLWPVALVACALWALAARRDGIAGLLLGLGIAAKLWPALVLPMLLVVAARRGALGRATSSVLLGAGIPFAFAFGLSPSGLWHALSLQAGRPLQVESLAAAALVSLQHLDVGGPYAVITSSGSQNLTGGLVGVAGTLSTVLSFVTVLGALALGVRATLRAPDDRAAISELARFGLCAVAAGIAFGHVLSPQFMLWLLPFPLLVAGRRGLALAALCALAAILTLEEFPGRYWAYGAGLDGGVAALILVRDLVLVAIVVVAVLPTGTRLRVSAAPSRSPSHDPLPHRTR
jgi:Glycosyltransferase family 87